VTLYSHSPFLPITPFILLQTSDQKHTTYRATFTSGLLSVAQTNGSNRVTHLDCKEYVPEVSNAFSSVFLVLTEQ
ncbi:hypothetical protein L9F63_000782, partial [Diploptera punctata]